MKTMLLLLSVSFLTPVIALAEEEQVAPHIFTDLNGNGVSDLEEGLSPGANPSANGIDQVEGPRTPEEEPPSE